MDIINCQECGKKPEIKSDFGDYSFTFLDYWVECECGKETRHCWSEENAIDEWIRINQSENNELNDPNTKSDSMLES